MINSQEIINQAQQQLLLAIKQLKSVEIIPFQEQILHANDFRTLQAFNKNIVFTKSKFPIIYTIELLEVAKRQSLLDTFTAFSTNNKTKIKNENRINHSKDNTINNYSNFLYVGSSTSDFIGRLKNHLGVRNSIRTYSLHLSKWDENLEYNIRVVTYQLKNKNEIPINNILVELIEQQIWDNVKPLFGKRSGLL